MVTTYSYLDNMSLVLSSTDSVLVRDSRVVKNLLTREEEFQIRDYCADKESNLAPHMRKIVTHWMMEVCEDQQCNPEVFFLSVNYLDRFLSSVHIQKNQFQLCASVCILLASKFSQVVPITTDKLVIYTDSSVTVEELRQWEIKILNVLQWELCSVTTHTFLEHFIPGLSSVLSNVNNNKVRTHAQTIAAMAATEYAFICAKPSIIAAAALSVAIKEEVEDEKESKAAAKRISEHIKCSYSEILFYANHFEKLLMFNNYSLSDNIDIPAPYKRKDMQTHLTNTHCSTVAAVAA